MSYHQIQYSEKYYDDKYEYRHVILPQDIASKVPRDRLLSEYEWRSLGIQMSRGWIHYGHHQPEPHILLFRRVYTSGPVTPRVLEEQEYDKNFPETARKASYKNFSSNVQGTKFTF